MIYRRETKRPLSNYQKQINEAAGEIALRDPSILSSKKGRLLEAAKEEVYLSGYAFKKGRSRSKRFSTDSSSDSSKRTNLNKDIRECRIRNVNEEITDLTKRISFKEKRVTVASNMKQYRTCDELTGEISELKSKRRELEAELKELQKKDKRAKTYQKSRDQFRPLPLSPLSSDDEPSKSKKLLLESPSPTTSLSSHEVEKSSSDGYQWDSSTSRSTTASPAFSKAESEFTVDEVKKFNIRFQEGYNLPDKRYQAWLKVNHPEASIVTTEMPTGDSQVLVSPSFESRVSPTSDVYTAEPPTPPSSVASSQQSF